MKLYGYFRSSTSYRARIALNLKGLSYDLVPVHLIRDGGQHLSADYRAVNPAAAVPSLELADGTVLTQSLAICEYLDEICPEPPLLPPDAVGRARVRAFSQGIACDIHPVNNLRILRYLGGPMGHEEEARNTWYRHWVEEGFRALEALVADHPSTGRFVHGDSPTLADICLVPQMYNARRFDVDLTPYPTLCRLEEAARALDAFARAEPECQPDATV